MTIISPYRVAQASTTTGTSAAYSLTAGTSQFRNFRDSYLNGQNVPYVSSDNTANFEIGIGTIVYGSPDTLERDTILASSNGGLAVNWGAGSRNIFAFALDNSAYAKALTTSYSVELQDWGTCFTYTSGSAVNLTLPVLGEVPLGWTIRVKHSGTNLLSLIPHGSDQIEALGGSTHYIVPTGGSLTVTSDLTVWRLLDNTHAVGSINASSFSTTVSPTIADWGTTFVFTGSSAGAVSLPALAGIPIGYAIGFKNSGSSICVFTPNGTDQIENFGAGDSWTSVPSTGAAFTSDGVVWRLINQVDAFGGSAFPVLFSTNQSLHVSNWGKTFCFDGSSAGVVVTLPSIAAAPTGYQVAFKNDGTIDFAVSPNGSDAIESLGASTDWQCTPGASATFASDGTVWRLIEVSYPPVNAYRIFTGTGGITALDSDDIIIVKKATPAVTTVTLPAAPPVGYSVTVVDGSGNANSFNITVTVASSGTINGSTTYLMIANYESTSFAFNGTEYNIVGRYYSGFGS